MNEIVSLHLPFLLVIFKVGHLCTQAGLCQVGKENSKHLSALGSALAMQTQANQRCPWARGEGRGWWLRGFYHFLSFFLDFQDRASLCGPDCTGSHSVHQAGLEVRKRESAGSEGICCTGITTLPPFSSEKELCA